jgi:fatty-acid desaturase
MKNSIKNLSFNTKIRTLQLTNHVLVVVGLAYCLFQNDFNLLLISLGVYILTLPLGTVCGLHRLLAHKSYRTSRFWEKCLTIFSIYATLGSSITWVALHRLHHTTAEKTRDPHSPYIGRNEGETLKFDNWQAFKSWIGLWQVVNIPPRFAMDLIHDPFHSFIHRHYFTIIIASCVALAIINPWLIIFAYAIPACMSLHATSVISVVAHRHGYKTHKLSDESRNSWIANIVTLGDGWHNNHHAKPGNWTTREKWYEFDPCGAFIRLIKS